MFIKADQQAANAIVALLQKVLDREPMKVNELATAAVLLQDMKTVKVSTPKKRKKEEK